MTEYKCGHKSEMLILDSNPLSISAFLEWKEHNEDDKECFDCWCERCR